VLLYPLFGTVPPLLVGLYARITDERTYSGPAIPVAAVLGLAVAALLYDVLRPLVGIAAQWVAYFGITTLPVAGIPGSSWHVAGRPGVVSLPRQLCL